VFRYLPGDHQGGNEKKEPPFGLGNVWCYPVRARRGNVAPIWGTEKKIFNLKTMGFFPKCAPPQGAREKSYASEYIGYWGVFAYSWGTDDWDQMGSEPLAFIGSNFKGTIHSCKQCIESTGLSKFPRSERGATVRGLRTECGIFR